MPPVRSFPRSVTVLHPAPYALPVGSSLEVEMPLPLVQSTSAHASSSRAGASAGGDFSPERIRAAARKLARKEGRMLVDEAELNAGVMGRGGPGEVSTIKVGRNGTSLSSAAIRPADNGSSAAITPRTERQGRPGLEPAPLLGEETARAAMGRLQ
jgi:hypothetical protein